MPHTDESILSVAKYGRGSMEMNLFFLGKIKDCDLILKIENSIKDAQPRGHPTWPRFMSVG